MEDIKPSIRSGASLLLSKVNTILVEEGVKSYLIGGFVRDILLGRDTADIDIAVAKDALEVAPGVASALGGKYVPMDEENGIARVVLADNGATSFEGRWELDFSTLRGDIEQDLGQRDFTVNAMAIELEMITYPAPSEKRDRIPISLPALIDPFKGRDDLRRRVIRAVGEAAFKSDPIRLLRAVRLATELDFSIESETEALIKRYAHLIASVAGERVREELLRILAAPGARHLAYLDELGLLTAIIPELAQAKGVQQPWVHFWDVFDHSIQTVAAIEFLLRQGTWEYAGEGVLAAVLWSAELSQHFDQKVSSGSTRRSLLKLAALLHDIAKPRTKTVDEDGRARFIGHTKEGAAITAGILERLRFSTREIKLVEVTVNDHLRPGQMSQYELPSRRAIYRYFRDTGEAGIDILFLSLADHLAARGPNLNLAEWQKHTQMVEYIMATHFEEEKLTVPPKLIDGHDIINIFGLSPGQKIGELLEAVNEAQAAGEVATREEALTYIEHLLTPSRR